MIDVRKDFSSIFSRPPNHLSPLDGFRVLLNFSVVALHVYQFLTFFMPREGDVYHNWAFHPLSNVYMYWSIQFSGFLFMRQILSSLDRQGSFDPKQIIINKFYRLAPSMYVIMIVCILLGDPNVKSFPAAFAFVRNYVSHCDNYPNTIGHLWSNSLEMQLCVAGVILCYALHKIGMLNMKALLAVFGLSWVIHYHLFDAELANIGNVGGKAHYTYSTAKATVRWFKDEFDVTLLTNKTCSDDPTFTGYAETFYLPAECRYIGYIVGCMLAYKLHQLNKTWKTTQHKTSVFWKSLGWVLFVLSSLMLLFLLVPPEESHPPEIVLLIITISFRQMFTTALAFVLYCTLVPEDHPFYSRVLASFFGMRLWYPLAFLSYGVYLLHYRFMWEAFRWIKPKPEDITPADHLKFWLVLMAVSQVAAVIEFLLIQGPVIRWRQSVAKQKHS